MVASRLEDIKVVVNKVASSWKALGKNFPNWILFITHGHDVYCIHYMLQCVKPTKPEDSLTLEN